jgi:peptide/nickel transport system ATP-binding protein
MLKLLPANLSQLSGSILFQGDDILRMPERRFRKLRGSAISMIFQDPSASLNPVFTIETQMVDVLRAKQVDLSRSAMRKRAVDMLHTVGIADAARRIGDYPHQFSGGMRQRIMIAMALMTEPQRLVADEPTTALDVTSEAQIVRLLERLRSELGVSIVFISHSLGLVSELCDDVVVMYAGAIVEQAPAAELFSDPQHPYTQALLACETSTRDESDRRLVAIPGEVPDLIAVPSGCVFVDRCDRSIPICRDGQPALWSKHPGHEAACVHVGMP